MKHYRAVIYHYPLDNVTHDSIDDCIIEQERASLSKEFLDNVKLEMEWAAIRENVKINAIVYRDNTPLCGMGLNPTSSNRANFVFVKYSPELVSEGSVVKLDVRLGR